MIKTTTSFIHFRSCICCLLETRHYAGHCRQNTDFIVEQRGQHPFTQSVIMSISLFSLSNQNTSVDTENGIESNGAWCVCMCFTGGSQVEESGHWPHIEDTLLWWGLLGRVSHRQDWGPQAPWRTGMKFKNEDRKIQRKFTD